jgi:AcrR family transcriptional regulator
MASSARAPKAERSGAGTARSGRAGPTRELRARGQRTLRRLLDAGATVFAARGYHAARVDDVVKAAKTSHGTFYLYFSSKEDLFRALAEDAASAMVALARELPTLRPGAEGYDDLHAWLGRFTDLYDSYGAVIRTWTEAEMVESEIGRIGNELVSEFSRQLARRVRVAAPTLDHRVAATALVSMIERSHYYFQARQLRIPRDELVTTLTSVTQAGLFGAEAARPARTAAVAPTS